MILKYVNKQRGEEGPPKIETIGDVQTVTNYFNKLNNEVSLIIIVFHVELMTKACSEQF